MPTLWQTPALGIIRQIFITTLYTIAKIWKKPKGSMTDEWIKKMWCIYTMEYYSAIKKNAIMSFSAT